MDLMNCFKKPSCRKSDTFLLVLPNNYFCFLCGLEFSFYESQEKTFCLCCFKNFCSNCLKAQAILSNTEKIENVCEPCFEECWKNQKNKQIEGFINEKTKEIQRLNEENAEIDIKRFQALENLRALNLKFANIESE